MTMPADFAPSCLKVQIQGALGTLTLSRPQRLNALSPQTLSELIAAAQWFNQQPEVKVVLVQGEGRAFCAGFDLTAFGSAVSDASPHAQADQGRQVLEAIEGMRAVTVCALQGHVVGGGLLLALACDLRYAAMDAVFSIPEVDLGIPLAWGGIPRLVRELGPALTRELVLTCRPFGAAEALAWRFVNRVVTADGLTGEALTVAQQLAARPALLLQMTKTRVARASESLTSTTDAEGDAAMLLQALTDAECRDSAQSYLQSRRKSY